MAIIKEQINDKLIKHYSDKGLYIKQLPTNIEYSEAVDVIPCRYTYVETDKPIEAAEQQHFMRLI